MMKSILIMLISALLASCAQSLSIQLVEVTRIIPQTVIVTRQVEVIITATPKPMTPTPKVTSTPVATYTPKFIVWNTQQVIDAFIAAGLEAENPSPVTKDDYGLAPMTDIEGTHFFITSLCSDCGGRAFSFATQEDLQLMKDYYDRLSEASALFFSWVFVKGNILVKINGDLPDETARQYKAALNNMK